MRLAVAAMAIAALRNEVFYLAVALVLVVGSGYWLVTYREVFADPGYLILDT